MTGWHLILLAWMAYQLFTIFRAYFSNTRHGEEKAAYTIALIIGVGLWVLLFAAMMKCGLLSGIRIGNIRIE